jgi:endonuclease/exonuclease/phosphatase family metal-dependent hydrolase
MKRRLRKWRWVLGIVILALVLPVLMFCFNGLVLATREKCVVTQREDAQALTVPGEVKILAYNIAKGFAQRSGFSFNTTASVEVRLRKMAEVINTEKPDIVVLSEVMTECDPCPVDQLEFLARECRMPYKAFGENYNFGLPFYRVVGGNAILSRLPLQERSNPSLPGRKAFYITRNNRRALMVSVKLGGQEVVVASLHNDSFDIVNNEAQVEFLLNSNAGPMILAGDFNATPGSKPMKRLEESGRFVGEWSGDVTYLEKALRLDYILAPKAWTHLETRVISSDASDHHAVVSRFRY